MNNLFLLGHHLENESYLAMSKKMLNNILDQIESYGAGYSNWAMLLLNFTQPFYEIAIVGKSFHEKRKSFNQIYLPNVIMAGCETKSNLPLLLNRGEKGETLIYVCTNKTCNKPVSNVNEALQQLK